MVAVGDDANLDAERKLADHAGALADGIETALPGWVQAQVERLAVAFRGGIDDDLRARAAEAGRRARAEVGPRVRSVLEADIDEQRTNPLAVVRGAVRYPTQVLRQAGIPPVVRDEHAERQFPDDLYDLTPARFADLDASLHDIGLRWGAAKAFVFKARRRSEADRDPPGR
jgi:hypothetical protein